MGSTYHTVECSPFITSDFAFPIPVLSSAELAEILRGTRDNVLVEFEDDPA